MPPSQLNVHQKLARARRMVSEGGLTKGGINSYAGWTYLELSDIVPLQNRIFAELGLIELFTFEPATPSSPPLAIATVVNADDPSQTIEFRLSWLQLEEVMSRWSGRPTQNALQRQGSEQTYLRRYLKMQVLDLAVTDEIDLAANAPAIPNPPVSQTSRPATPAERQRLATDLANAYGPATQLQLRQLKRAVALMQDTSGSADMSALASLLQEDLTASSDQLTKQQAESLLGHLDSLRRGTTT